MHKSDGTAIWFEEAAEQLGVDTMRWMYLAQNPALDLRFGRRHKDQPVTIETPDGPIAKTREGEPTCLVTSRPSDEIRRQILIPLWNSYAFFVNYAIADEFDPGVERISVPERPEIDRWILSNLQALIAESRRAFEAFDVAAACAATARFIDDLSNWYIRRNRRRFWRSKDAGDRDKLAAYQTLHEVLVTLTKLLAPMVPFLAERMYQNLVHGRSVGATDNGQRITGPQPSTLNPQPSTARASVHLCDYPEPHESLLDPDLNARMAIAQLVVRLGHKLRDEASLRVRQPLAEVRYACADPTRRQAIAALAEVIAEELNVKRLAAVDDLGNLVRYSYKPNLKTLGPKYGKLLGALRQQIPQADPATLAPLRAGQNVTLSINGSEVVLLPEDVLIETQQASGWLSADEAGVQIALSTAVTPELKREGMARDLVRHVQQLRKDANLDIQDRVRIGYTCDDPEFQQMVAEWSDYIRAETLADALDAAAPPADARQVRVGDVTCWIWIQRA
jgi:isoleucyl-tRNA synthetase